MPTGSNWRPTPVRDAAWTRKTMKNIMLFGFFGGLEKRSSEELVMLSLLGRCVWDRFSDPNKGIFLEESLENMKEFLLND